MSGNEKRALTPRLRFPEFREVGEWNYNELSPFLQEHAERVPTNTALPVYSSTRTGLQLQKDYYDNRELENDGEYGVVPEEFFVYRHMSDDGAFKFNINKTGEQIAVSKEYPVFSTVDLHPNFLLHLLNDGEGFKRFALAQKKGGTRTRLYLNVLRTWKALLPSYSEQQKIADCLSSLDDLITAEAQKLDALKIYKKGLMQQLFPAEGETVPCLRFPEFRDAGEWELYPLEKYFKHIRNGFVGTATPHYVSNGVPYLQGKNVKQGQINETEMIFVSCDFHQSQQKSQLRTNDVLMVQSGHVGECALVNQQYAGSNCHALIIMSPNKSVHSKYFVHYFYSPQGQNRISKITTGNTIKHILASDLKTLEVSVPILEEQQKIADCLSSLDDLIAAQTQKIDALKAHKKGLMQQLFPTIGEEQ